MQTSNLNNDWQEFSSNILKLRETRTHKVTNSLGVYDAYKWIRKNKWLNIPRPLTEHEFYSIIRYVNKEFLNLILEGKDIDLPRRMGRIELRKYETNVRFDEGKIKTNLPIDWNKTIKLWYEDKESYSKKLLVRRQEKEVFRLRYSTHKACYNNKTFFTFKFNRKFKTQIKNAIKERHLDAFKI